MRKEEEQARTRKRREEMKEGGKGERQSGRAKIESGEG
jgi:hypothetical protein